MKKSSTQTSQEMEISTINRSPGNREPKKEVLHIIRQFARAYYPLHTSNLPGLILN